MPSPSWTGGLLNRTEKDFKERVEKIGYQVHRNGWPDFLITRDGKLFCLVELKTFGDPVRPEQEAMHTILRAAGVKVHVVYADQCAVFLDGLRACAPAEWSEGDDLHPGEWRARQAGRLVDAAIRSGLWDGVTPPDARDDDDAAQVGVR